LEHNRVGGAVRAEIKERFAKTAAEARVWRAALGQAGDTPHLAPVRAGTAGDDDLALGGHRYGIGAIRATGKIQPVEAVCAEGRVYLSVGKQPGDQEVVGYEAAYIAPTASDIPGNHDLAVVLHGDGVGSVEDALPNKAGSWRNNIV
jgi:hypothetical protein